MSRTLSVNPVEQANTERARQELPQYFFSQPAPDGSVTVWHPETGTECRCTEVGGSCPSAKFFSPVCKHAVAVRLRRERVIEVARCEYCGEQLPEDLAGVRMCGACWSLNAMIESLAAATDLH